MTELNISQNFREKHLLDIGMNGDMAGVVAESWTLPPWNFEFGK